MFKRAISWVAFVMLALLVAFPAAAQSDWSLYLFNSSTQQVLRVYLDGTQQAYDLGIPAGSFTGQRSIDFSSDGNRVAFCVPVNEPNGAHSYLYIKDVASSQPLTVDMGMGDGCWVTYSEDNTQVAVGVVHYYAGATGVDTSVPPWELVVVDAATGQKLDEMNAAKAAVAQFDPEPRSYMPDVRYFNNSQIIFGAVPWGTEGFPISPAYFWQLGDDSIQSIDRWWRWGVDSLSATGELVWMELDPNFAAADPGGPMPQSNVVKLADKSGQEHVIYANPQWVLTGTHFIDNGRQLAIGELQAFDLNNPEAQQTTRWMALDRSGTVSELASGLGFSELSSAPDGYIILWASDNNIPSTLTLEYRSGRETTQLWQQQANNGISWSLLWAAPTPTADGLAAFPAVTP
ncbi:MAG: hypothetical protein ABI835_09435 [Chloroflexota bacterium]